MKKVKALVLLSGGLDSMLAVKVLQEQGIEVTGITFESNFYNAEKSKKVVEQLNIPLKIVDISKEMLDLVKNPSSGHGKHMNPCIDCHSLMIKKASDFLKKETKSLSTETGERDSVSEYDIIATGEVVGQRPFSQTKQALERVRNYSGVDVLRPLSAKLLPETEFQIMEKGGEVEDFNLLASCDGIIGANSSFSYWAAYLNPNPDTRKVFPSVKNWYKDGIERTVCPKEWIRI